MANFWANACSEAFNEPLAAKLEGAYASCGTTVSVAAFVQLAAALQAHIHVVAVVAVVSVSVLLMLLLFLQVSILTSHLC